MCPHDEDIKIFHPSKSDSDTSDFVELAAMTDYQRRCGNTSKARVIGEQLAELDHSFPEQRGCELGGLESNELYQVRVLMIFAFQISLHRFMPNAVISAEAVNTMFNKLKENSETFFYNITDGSSFTFYYLSLRRNRDVEKNIGKNFAMLCERDNDERYLALGERIFTSMCSYVCDLIEENEFVE